MTDLLEHPLVKKYFGEDRPGGVIHCDDPKTFQYKDWIAGNVLRAMQQPIGRGERALQYQGSFAGHWEIEMLNCTGQDITGWHPNELRLPDRFQPVEKKEDCIVCDGTIGPLAKLCKQHDFLKPDPPKDAVEAKIMKICMDHGAISGGWEHELRELVNLARKA